MPPRIVVRGTGRPIVLIPGLQGRYEWGLPTVEALARLGRVVTYSLADEPTSAFPWSEAAGFENYVWQLADVVRRTATVPPVLVGVSYGGLVATEFASRHPDDVAGLVVASAPPPAWTLPARARRYLAAPRLMAPAFWLGAPFRVYPELKAAIPDTRRRLAFMAGQGLRIAAAPASSRRMVRRLRWLSTARSTLDRPIAVPALIVVGEPELERVVPPHATLAYRAWLPGATVVTLTGTGHGGTITRADQFADQVSAWMQHLPHARPREVRVPALEESVRADRVS